MTWLRKMLNSSLDWEELFPLKYKIDRLVLTDTNYQISLKSEIKNPFWKDVVIAYGTRTLKMSYNLALISYPYGETQSSHFPFAIPGAMVKHIMLRICTMRMVLYHRRMNLES